MRIVETRQIGARDAGGIEMEIEAVGAIRDALLEGMVRAGGDWIRGAAAVAPPHLLCVWRLVAIEGGSVVFESSARMQR